MAKIKLFGILSTKVALDELIIEADNIEELLIKLSVMESNLNMEELKRSLIFVNNKNIIELNMFKTKIGLNDNVSILSPIAGATLWSLFPEKTKDIMENVLKFEKVDERLDVIRYKSTASIGNIIDLKTTPMGLGKMGIGTVHHIALRVKDENELIEWSNMLKERGFIVSPVRDRKYFKSIYFREKGGNLFEIATDGPGFTVDEPVGELGKNLKLPSQYESIRDEIEKKLPPINVKEF